MTISEKAQAFIFGGTLIIFTFGRIGLFCVKILIAEYKTACTDDIKSYKASFCEVVM
jgi:hypothetical protein